jgi:copper transport outer membrane protein MctB
VGYSARYHVASLAAVFLALAVGILIGTGLSGVVSDTTKSLESTLRGRIDDAENLAADRARQLGRDQAFEEAAYPGLVKGLLLHDRIAVLSLGSPGNSTSDALGPIVGGDAPTGAEVAANVVIGEPPDPSAIVAGLKGLQIGGQTVHNLAGNDALQTAIAKRFGRSLASGGPFYRSIRGTIVDKQSGALSKIDAVIVVRQQPGSLDPAQAEVTDRFEAGILDGLRSTGLPVVGVERSDTDPSSVSLYSDHNVASVDDIDLFSGRVALAYTLRGVPGTYGVKSTADSLLPKLAAPHAPAGTRP